MELAIVIGGELVIRVSASFAEHELTTGGRVGARKQKSTRIIKLIAFESQQLRSYRVDRSSRDTRVSGEHGRGQRAWGAICWQNRERSADDCSRGKTAALPSALIIHEKETTLAFLCDRSAQAAAENVLLDIGPAVGEA